MRGNSAAATQYGKAASSVKKTAAVNRVAAMAFKYRNELFIRSDSFAIGSFVVFINREKIMRRRPSQR
jgi:hypothetical protein